ncbi:hypothetical protein ACM66B_001546 [Microbotryomycetes sp. NB124-2]
MAVLIVSALDNVLRQLVSATQTPHTALVVSVPSGNVIASQSTADEPATAPFPSFYEHGEDAAPAHDPDDRGRTTHRLEQHATAAAAASTVTEQRARAFAAVVTSMWTIEKGDWHKTATTSRSRDSSSRQRQDADDGGDSDDLLMLDTELGRIAAIRLGSFLLVLVGSRVTPWTVLDKKIRVAEGVLRQPLETVSSI